MQNLILLFLMMGLVAPLAKSQNKEALDFLKSEIQRAAKQRDEAQKRLLEVQSDSADQVKTLNQAQLDLRGRLESTSKDLLELEAAAQMSKVAMERSEQELQSREDQIQSLSKGQIETAKAYEEVTRKLSEELTEVRLQASQPSSAMEADVEKLAEERQKLRNDLLNRDQELADLRTKQQQSLSQLTELKQLNGQLSEELRTSQRAESLSNAKLAALESRLTNLQQELANQYQERSELEQEQERLQGVIVDLQNRLDEAVRTRVPKSQMDELSATLESAVEENLRLKDDLSNRDDVPDLRKDFEAIRKERDLLQAKQKTLLTKVDALEQELKDSGLEKKKLGSENRKLRGELNTERKLREKMENEIVDLENILKDATSAGIEAADLEDVALLLAGMEREKEAFRLESLEHRKNVDVLRVELDNQQSSQNLQISQLQNMLGRQLEEITSSQKKIEALEVRSLTLDEVRKQKAQLVGLQDRSRQDMRTLAKHIYQLREELVRTKETQRKAVLAVTKNQELVTELDSVREQIQKLNRLNSAIQSQDGNKESRILELRQELETGRARSQSLEQEKRALLNQLRIMQERRSQGE